MELVKPWSSLSPGQALPHLLLRDQRFSPRALPETLRICHTALRKVPMYLSLCTLSFVLVEQTGRPADFETTKVVLQRCSAGLHSRMAFAGVKVEMHTLLTVLPFLLIFSKPNFFTFIKDFPSLCYQPFKILNHGIHVFQLGEMVQIN